MVRHLCRWKVKWTLLLRWRRSRNKVSVGEPAEGSITRLKLQNPATYCGAFIAHSSCLTFFSITIQIISKVSYNFWRWMSRLRQRWRTPQNAISFVNGRIPRINRMLNAYCTFRLLLKVCLNQGVYTIMQSKNQTLFEFSICVCVCQRRISVDALNTVVDRLTRTPLGDSFTYSARLHCLSLTSLFFCSRMISDKVTRWI